MSKNKTLQIRNSTAEGEINKNATCKDFLQVQKGSKHLQVPRQSH